MCFSYSIRRVGWVLVLGLLTCGWAMLQAGAAEEPKDAPAPLTQEQTDAVLQYVHTWRPSLAERLNQLKETDPQQYQSALQRLANSDRVRRFMSMKQADPKGFDLRAAEWRLMAEAGRLSRNIASAGDAEKEALKAQLKQKVVELFDMRLKVREHELQQLEVRLGELRQQLKDQKLRRDELVEKQYDRLLTSPPRELFSGDR